MFQDPQMFTSVQNLDHLRDEANKQWQMVESSVKEAIYWTMPHRLPYLTGEEHGKRNNQHIVDPTHIIALRSYVAGFSEGNTSASRSWFKYRHPDTLMNKVTSSKKWIDHFNDRCTANAQQSNLYLALGEFYYEYGSANTGVLFLETRNKKMFWTVIPAGSYRLMMGPDGRSNILIYERCMSVKMIVEEYGTYTESGKPDWSKFSERVKNAYESGRYSEEIEIVTVVQPNKMFSERLIELGKNRKYVATTYESTKPARSAGYDPTMGKYQYIKNDDGSDKILRTGYYKKQPFIAGKNSGGMFPYGERGPTTESLGLIKANNKRRLKQDKAIDQMVDPTTYGPASVRKSYLSTAPSVHVPMSPEEMKLGGLKRLFEINPAIGALIQDTKDERGLINKLYYQDFLLYLTQNQKTRTAEEVRAVQSEQQLVVGPNFQSLNWTVNLPLTDMIADWTLANDPFLPPPPKELGGQSIQPVFISLFAQAQKSADLPNIQTFLNMVLGVGTVNQEIMLKLDTSVLADIFEDRLFLPAGLVRSKEDVDAMKEQMQNDMRKQQQLETIQAAAGAAKDLGITQGAKK